MSAPVTEAHIELVRYVLEPEWYGSSVEAKFARLIAESEAKATAELRSEIAELKESILVQQIFSDDRIRANEAEAELAAERAEVRAVLKIVNEQTARAESAEREVEQKRNLLTVAIKSAGDQATRAERAELERDQLRTELTTCKDASESLIESLRAEVEQWELAFQEQYARAEKAESELAEQKWLKESAVKRAKELTKELAAANAKLLRNESDGYLCELERTRAELAVERARLDWLMAGGVCMVQHSGGFYVSRLHAQVSRAAIDSGMKEVAK